MSDTEPLSRRRIDAAGDTLRQHRLGELADPAQLAAAFEALARFRRRWEGETSAVVFVAEELRRIAGRLCAWDAEVSERIKREDRILDKLVRLPSLALSRVQDIGGCRVVVPTLTNAVAVRGSIRERWGASVRREYDYVNEPKPDGYRAVHVVVEQQSCLIEIQVRTRLQHAWARTVERLEYRAHVSLRAGAGDPALQLALRTLAEVLAELEPNAPDSPGQVSDGAVARPSRTRADLDDVMAVIQRAW